MDIRSDLFSTWQNQATYYAPSARGCTRVAGRWEGKHCTGCHCEGLCPAEASAGEWWCQGLWGAPTRPLQGGHELARDGHSDQLKDPPDCENESIKAKEARSGGPWHRWWNSRPFTLKGLWGSFHPSSLVQLVWLALFAWSTVLGEPWSRCELSEKMLGSVHQCRCRQASSYKHAGMAPGTRLGTGLLPAGTWPGPVVWPEPTALEFPYQLFLYNENHHQPLQEDCKILKLQSWRET